MGAADFDFSAPTNWDNGDSGNSVSTPYPDQYPDFNPFAGGEDYRFSNPQDSTAYNPYGNEPSGGGISMIDDMFGGRSNQPTGGSSGSNYDPFGNEPGGAGYNEEQRAAGGSNFVPVSASGGSNGTIASIGSIFGTTLAAGLKALGANSQTGAQGVYRNTFNGMGAKNTTAGNPALMAGTVGQKGVAGSVGKDNTMLYVGIAAVVVLLLVLKKR